MSNVKIMLHRILNSSSFRSQEKLFAKLKTATKLTGGVWTKSCIRLFNDRLSALKSIGLQCNVIAAHRVRRSGQIMKLYHCLYGKSSPAQFFRKLGDLIKRNPEGKMFFLLGAAFFDWNENRVVDYDLKTVADELKDFFDVKITGYHDKQGETWEKVHDHDHFKLWRCPVEGSSLYKYKVFGSYTDIPARAFFNIQMDLEYRKSWDNHVVTILKVDEDEQTNSEVVYWATKFPLGILYDRDYVYVRRGKIDQKNNYMMLAARSVEHPSCPVHKDYVRVGVYTANMMIKPHKTFDENGFDYVMSYYDEPQLSAPTWMVNKLTMKSLPSFLEQLHQAAKQLIHTDRYINRFEPQDTDNTAPIHTTS